VDLSARRHTLYDGADAVRTFPVAVGQPGTPTPTGRFFVTVRLRPPQISAVYGAWALGLSAYSEVLDQFGTGDGQIALHGTANTFNSARRCPTAACACPTTRSRRWRACCRSAPRSRSTPDGRRARVC
jgi:lipoprotein-anchoring transpeptidase ErfK/SrfK